MRTMPLLMGLTLALSSGCYRPSLPSGHYQCTATEDCPAGQECLGGLCYRPGEVDLAGTERDLRAPEDTDMSAEVMPDMTVLDLSDPTVDLTGADLTPVPCTGPGTTLTALVSACKGNFTSITQQRMVCGTGYHICESRDVVALIAAGATGLCTTAGGFYAARIAASSKMMAKPSDTVCPPKASDTAMLIGCGSETNTGSFNNVNCYGMSSAFPCKTTSNAEWQCSSSGLDGAAHMNGQGKGGLLCCKD